MKGVCKLNDVAFLTVIYPIKKEYIEDYMLSISSQTCKNFDLVLLNDGYEYVSELRERYPSINIIEVKLKASISKNRQYLLNYAIKNNYSKVVFGDIDDCFCKDRVLSSISYLDDYDVVVNELSPFDETGNIYKNYLSNRFESDSEIYLSDIMDKNIMGFTNTAINLQRLSLEEVVFADRLIAVDWFLFSYLLSIGAKVYFTAEVDTHYRQHELNTVGILNENTQENIYNVKKIHYEEMLKINDIYSNYLDEISRLNLRLKNNKASLKISHPLWWE